MSEDTSFTVTTTISLSLAEVKMLEELTRELKLNKSAIVRIAIRMIYQNRQKLKKVLGVSGVEEE